MRSILLLPLVARCLETIDVCIWRMFAVCLHVCCCLPRLGLSSSQYRFPLSR